ncbi:DUF6452 family protein [Epilithonimonas sp.]|uniref:DUF6452 family protein n=1 Tax=Epilithonimonas sp. TaxID=2894511 RepID=UPI0035B27E30
MQKLFFLLGFFLLLTSCGSDDDICLSSESTPRLQVKFKNEAGQLTKIDSLYINVDYGNNKLTNILAQANAETVFIPLRIDDSLYTDIYFKTAKDGDSSKVRVSYDKNAVYVSPACGFKINYENLKSELIKPNPLLNVESNHTSLTDESKVNFYLRF